MSRVKNKFLLKATLLMLWVCPIVVFAADPYLQSPSSTGISISWNDAQVRKSRVEYGTTSALGTWTLATELPSVLDADKVWHTVRLRGLTPDTEYYYKCVTGTTQTEIFKFRTFPTNDASTGHFRILVYGDNRSNPLVHKRIVDSAVSKIKSKYGDDIHNQLNLVMNSGDILNNGNGLNGYTSEYLNPINILSKNVPYMVSIGNHEYESPIYYKYMDYESCDTPTGATKEKYYSFRAGPILFAVMNSNLGNDTTQRDWIEDRLITAEADATIDWIIGFMHHPGHSEVWPDGNTGFVNNLVIPLFTNPSYSKACGLYYGHSHNFEVGADLESPLRFLLSGGGGGHLDRWHQYPNQTDYPEIYKAHDYFCYTILDFDLSDRSYTAETYSLGHADDLNVRPGVEHNNVLIDTFHQSRSATVPPVTPTAFAPLAKMPVKLIASPFSPGSDQDIMSSQFQVTSTPGNYASPLINKHRDWINVYSDTNFPLFTPIDKNAGINLEELIIESGVSVNDQLAWRVRYRDQNLIWSEWSAETSFTVQTEATTPSPANDSVSGADATLTWVTGSNVDSHDVYLGTSPELDANDLKGNQATTSYSAQGLSINTTYYWRIDEVRGGVKTTGVVWHFNVPPAFVVSLNMNDDTFDLSGRGVDGTAVGSPVYVTGQIGKAIVLDTKDKYVSLGTPGELDFGTTVDFSVAFWVKTSGWSGDPVMMTNKDWGSGTNTGWIIAGSGNGTSWQWNYTGSGNGRVDFDPAIADSTINDGNWHQIVVTHDRDGNALFYHDGVNIGSVSLAGQAGTIDSGLPTVIGQRGTFASTISMNATYDDVGIWRRILTPAEITTFYNDGLAGKSINENLKPTVDDKTVVVHEGYNVEVELTGSDTNLGDTLTYSIVTAPSNGTLTGVLPTVKYTPGSNFSGNDSFTYKANDGKLDSTPATISIRVENFVTYLKLEDNAEDSSGSGTFGAVVGSPAYVSGKVGQGIELNTPQKYVSFGTAEKLNFGTDVDFSVALWIKTSGWDADPVIITNKDWQLGENPGWVIAGSGNGSSWQWNYTGTGSKRVDFDPTLAVSKIDDGQWHHIVVTHDRDGNATFYQDGLQIGSISIAGSTGTIDTGYETRLGFNAVTPLHGGLRSTSTVNYSMEATYDDVVITNRVLSPAEITTIYDEANAGETKFLDDGSNLPTPVVGLELVQTGRKVTWTLENEIGVIKYQLVDANGNLVVFINSSGGFVTEISANGLNSYSVTLNSDVEVELVVVDNFGKQVYVPIDGNIETTPYELKKGWNLIAITGDHADISPLQNVAVGPLWAWNGSNYEHITAPVVTQAVWINSKVEQRVDVVSDKSKVEIALEPGWNLVGPINNEPVPEGVISVFSYNGNYTEIYSKTGILIRGVGYWLFSE